MALNDDWYLSILISSNIHQWYVEAWVVDIEILGIDIIDNGNYYAVHTSVCIVYIITTLLVRWCPAPSLPHIQDII